MSRKHNRRDQRSGYGLRQRENHGQRHRAGRTYETHGGCYGKVRYRDWTEAKRALNNVTGKGRQRDSTPVRVYPCDHCGGYHLTSWT